MTKEQNQLVYKTMYKYLLEILPQEISKKDLERYFESEHPQIDSLETVYEQFLFSAQNYQSMPNVIKFIQRKDVVKSILFDYDFEKISKLSPEQLYHTLRTKFNVTSVDSKHNSWYKWSKSAIDCAKFMTEFKDIDDFKQFVQTFDYNLPTRMALPLLIAQKVSGFQFALACDCLKELGYINYCKPDVHIVDVLTETGVVDTNNPIDVFEAITRMSKDCVDIDKNATPYKIDKVMWLICSGNFYLHNIKIKRHKEELIDLINHKLNTQTQLF